MNKTEHLLVYLAEECAEVQQAVAKALRFGLDDGAPDSTETNADDIAREFCDVIALIEILEENNIIPIRRNKEQIEKKKQKVKQYMDYAIDRGTLQ